MRSREEIWKKWRELEQEENDCVNYYQEILAIVNYAREECGDEEVEKILRYILEE